MRGRISLLLIAGLVLLALFGVVTSASAIKIAVIPSTQQSNHSPDGAYVEGTAMNDVAARLCSKLASRGFETFNTGYNYSSVNAACSAARSWGAQCTISNHTNACGETVGQREGVHNGYWWYLPHGTETFYLVNWSGYSSPGDIDIAQRCASKLVQKFSAFGVGYDGAAIANNQGDIVWNAPGDHCLVEALFHDNWNDCNVLKSDAGKDAYAQAVFEAICDHYGWTYSAIVNPPYWFDTDTQGWYAGGNTAALWWAGYPWNGSLIVDETGDNGYIYSPTQSFLGVGAQVLNVNLWPQGGNSASHDMKVYWKSDQENYFDEAKSSNTAIYTAKDVETGVNLCVNNAKWWATINKMMLKFDGVNKGTRFIINHMALTNVLWWPFNSSTEGWYVGNSLSTLNWTGLPAWPGVIYADQTGNDAFLYSPAINTVGGQNDMIHVRLRPQGGTTTNHDMALYWISYYDTTWNEAKSVHVNYTCADDTWCDVYLPVGTNVNWGNSPVITQMRLDFDQTNHGTRWIVDNIVSEY